MALENSPEWKKTRTQADKQIRAQDQQIEQFDNKTKKAKKKEQDLKSWKELRDQAFADAEKWMLANRGVASFVQVGGDNRPITYADTVAGGLVMPS